MANTAIKVKAGNSIESVHAAADDASEGFYVAGIKVVGAQGATIAAVTPAADGTAVGTAFNTLLTRLKAHGLIA